jgi:hypothetical protein
LSERISGVAPDVLAKQLANERTRRERLEAEVLAFKARLLAGDPPELLVDVASVILEAQTAMQAPTSGGALGERVSTGKPTSRSPVRDERPVKAFNRFKSRVDGAVNGWTVEKEKDFERDRPDPESLARVWCNRVACDRYQVSLPRFHKSKKLGWVELSRICVGTLVGSEEVCGRQMADRS